MPLMTQAGAGGLQLATLNTINTLAAGMFPTQGNIFFVSPILGSDNNPGTVAAPFKTLVAALAAATPNQNDIIYLVATGNAAGLTTDYQNALLDWNKDQVHLIGVNAGPLFSQRSRVAFISSYAAATDLFKVSANGCLIQGIEFFMGVGSALPTGCMTVTGQRNHFVRCHIAGMGNSANDISGAYSLQLKGAEENLFEDCTIGQDTVQLGAQSNSVLLFSNASPGGCTRNWFRGCRLMLDTSHATNCLFLRSGATSIDRETVFEDCLFINSINSGSTQLTEAMAVVAGTSPAGAIIMTGSKTGLFGASKWNATATILFQTGGNNSTGVTGWGLAGNIT